jgi:Zn-dependent protease with chaperone function
MKYLFLISFTIIASSAFTQICSSGEIPSELFISTSKKHEEKKAILLDSSIYEPRDIRLARLKNLETNIYLIDAIKTQGDVYINDDYTKLINSIADHLLKNNLHIRKSLHFYAYKSPEVNAFSTDQGDLFFTIGLLAHLDNEAELAFVVAHEIVHFIKQHNHEAFNQKLKIFRGKDEYNAISVDESWTSEHAFSRSLEREADILALDYFISSKYDTSAIFSVLEKLKTSHLGYREASLNSSLFKSWDVKTLNSLYPKAKKRTKRKKKKFKFSTHPEIEDRIKYCQENLKNREIKKGVLHNKIQKDAFDELKKAARTEHILLLYDHNLFAKAGYNALIMNIDRDMNDSWLNNFITLCLLRVYQREFSSHKIHEKSAKYSGSIYDLWSVMYKNTPYNFLAFNFIHSYNNYVKNNDSQSKELFQESQTLMASAQEYPSYRYIKTGYDTADINDDLTKLLLKSIKKIARTELYKTEFDSLEKHKSRSTEGLPIIQLSQIDNIIVYNPYYIHMANQKPGYFDYVRSYNNEALLLHSIEESMNTHGINNSILDFRLLNKMDGDKVDDISTLGNYISQFIEYDMKIGTKVLPASKERLDAIRAKYQTDYVVWLAVRSYDESMGFTELNKTLNATTIFIPYMPFGIHKLLRNSDQSYLFYVIIDLKENEVVQKKEMSFEGTNLESKKEMTKYLNLLLAD